MSEVLFIRHAETDMAGRFCGHSDPALNARGKAQAIALTQLLSAEPIERVFTSDLSRAQQTAQAIADAKGLQLLVRPALREIHFGAWEGLSWQQIEERDTVYAQQWLAAFPHTPAPSGESFADFKKRVLAGLDQILQYQQGLTAVVTHAGVLRVVQQELLGSNEPWKENQPYCGVLRYRHAHTFAIGEYR